MTQVADIDPITKRKKECPLYADKKNWVEDNKKLGIYIDNEKYSN